MVGEERDGVRKERWWVKRGMSREGNGGRGGREGRK